jgi:hypothetical protein
MQLLFPDALKQFSDPIACYTFHISIGQVGWLQGQNPTQL